MDFLYTTMKVVPISIPTLYFTQTLIIHLHRIQFVFVTILVSIFFGKTKNRQREERPAKNVGSRYKVVHTSKGSRD